MTIGGAIAAGILIGAVVGAMARMGLGRRHWLKAGAVRVESLLREFRAATDDDVKGRCLRAAGLSMLALSLPALAFFGVVTALCFAFPFLTRAQGPALWGYWTVLSLVAAAMLAKAVVRRPADRKG